jgi:methionyl-tRNA formyltransferase
MNIVFLGTPDFAVPTLERLAASRHRVCAVFTQPDRPRGRGEKLAFPPVKEAALRLGIPVYQPERVRHPEAYKTLAALAPDAMVVVGYGQIIPQSIIDLPRHGIINVHASLLPRYRGAAPIQWAIANGETTTGVTTMQIDAGLDTGDILLAEETAIGPEETAPELSARLALMGADLLMKTLEGIESGVLQPRPQDHSLASVAPPLKKEDGLIDWNWPAQKIFNRCRGFLPWPGTYTLFRGQLLHVWKSRPAPERNLGEPGTLHPVRKRLLAACGDGTALDLLELQIEGRKSLPAHDFLNGQRIAENEKLGE